MASFDIVSKVDTHELKNAVDQATREIGTRFDFKGVDAQFVLNGFDIELTAPAPFQVSQMNEILSSKLTKRQIDINALDHEDPQVSTHQAKQIIHVKHGIDTDTAKKIVKFIKTAKLKVQASIQGTHVRVTGKKRDDLQDTITSLKEENFHLPLQFENFRD